MSDFVGRVSHPSDVFFNVINELLIFFYGVGIVKPKIAPSIGDFCLHEVKSHSLAMPNMKVSIWFWGESGENALSK